MQVALCAALQHNLRQQCLWQLLQVVVGGVVLLRCWVVQLLLESDIAGADCGCCDLQCPPGTLSFAAVHLVC